MLNISSLYLYRSPILIHRDVFFVSMLTLQMKLLRKGDVPDYIVPAVIWQSKVVAICHREMPLNFFPWT